MSPEEAAQRVLAERIADRLNSVHFDGSGCGTHGNNACSNCCGPSPMSAYEIAQDLAAMLVPVFTLAEADELDALRAEIVQERVDDDPMWDRYNEALEVAAEILSDRASALRASDGSGT